ncbi:MAG: hypothetical protein L0I24_07315, partial [Pseudonocardia sp.]|nr:hypothetical protein [Pseudonocardia sp.]
MAGHRRSRDVDQHDWVPFLPRLPRRLVITAFALGLLSIGLPNVAPDVDLLSAAGSPVRQLFGVSEEMNVPTFFSVGVFLAAASALVVAGVLAGGRLRSALGVTAGLLALLAFDDFAALHERLKAVGDLVTLGAFEYAWVLPGAVIGAVVVVAFWRLAVQLDGAARRDLLVGIAVFFVAALGFEAVNGFLDQPGLNGMPLQIGTHVEEVTENLGIILVLRGALSMVEISRARGWLAVRLADR